MTLTDASGQGETGYPLQFGRPFVDGAVPAGALPQVLVNGTSVPTQADVKNRYPDGSVEFAVIAAVIPSIPANGAVQLDLPADRRGQRAQHAADPGANARSELQFRRGDDAGGRDPGGDGAYHRCGDLGRQPGALCQRQLAVDHQWRLYDQHQRHAGGGDQDRPVELRRQLRHDHQYGGRGRDPRRQRPVPGLVDRGICRAGRIDDQLCLAAAHRV